MSDSKRDLPADAAKFAAKLLFALAHEAERFSRKRAVGDEDHWFPKHPEAYGLLPHQCYHCEDVLPDEPKRGCKMRKLR